MEADGKRRRRGKKRKEVGRARSENTRTLVCVEPKREARKEAIFISRERVRERERERERERPSGMKVMKC
jgi:hypothetical protein